MAQLRDNKTSAFLAEGTPLQMATLASKIGSSEVIFDDVGENFDPQAVLDSHAEVKASVPGDASEEYVEQVTDADKLERGAIKAANDAIAEARALLDQG